MGDVQIEYENLTWYEIQCWSKHLGSWEWVDGYEDEETARKWVLLAREDEPNERYRVVRIVFVSKNITEEIDVEHRHEISHQHFWNGHGGSSCHTNVCACGATQVVREGGGGFMPMIDFWSGGTPGVISMSNTFRKPKMEGI